MISSTSRAHLVGRTNNEVYIIHRMSNPTRQTPIATYSTCFREFANADKKRKFRWECLTEETLTSNGIRLNIRRRFMNACKSPAVPLLPYTVYHCRSSNFPDGVVSCEKIFPLNFPTIQEILLVRECWS